jgi:hypothetical protein
MTIILLNWWYTSGLKQQFSLIQRRLLITSDFFSISQLLRTLFNPFRQISVVNLRPDAPVDVRFRAWGDKLLSRFIGAFMRTCLIFIGILALLFQLLFGFLMILLHLALPFLPLLCLIYFFIGKAILNV